MNYNFLGDTMSIVTRVTIPKDLWNQLMKKYPELQREKKATAIRILLSKLLEGDKK